MIINNNIAALNTFRQFNANQFATAKNLEKLSSGLRINRAGDDAAGLAISEKMRGQIRGLDQATRNSQDGIALIQTAEGALNETHSILQRMRELAVQSSNDTLTDADRKALQEELNQLLDETDRIRNTTQFNTKNLLDGSLGKKVAAAVANVNSNSSLTENGAAVTTATLLTDLADKNGNNLDIKVDDVVEVSYVKDGETIKFSVTVAAATDITALDDANFTITDAAGTLNGTAATAGLTGAVHGLTYTVKNADGDIKQAATNAVNSFGETTAAKNKQGEGRATFQIGANNNQNMQLAVADMGTSALGVKRLDIDTQEKANVAIKVIDTAIQKVSMQRSALGATQNRLEHTINNLGTSSENLQAAESRIRDVDMAKEMMAFTKNNILSQAAQSMLAQANQRPQSVLQLLG